MTTTAKRPSDPELVQVLRELLDLVPISGAWYRSVETKIAALEDDTLEEQVERAWGALSPDDVEFITRSHVRTVLRAVGLGEDTP